MRRLSKFFVILCCACVLCGCGSSNTSDVDLDLTALSSTVQYAEVSNMYNAMDNYIGKTVKMSGPYVQLSSNIATYDSVLFLDATNCCNIPVEFVGDVPEGVTDGTFITVTGTFELYEEAGQMYFHIVASEIALQ